MVPPFAQQRLVAIALILAMALMGGVPALVLEPGKVLVNEAAEWPYLKMVSWIFCALTLVAAIAARMFAHSRAQDAKGEERAKYFYMSSLLPIVILEAGFMFGFFTWIVTGEALPGLVFACLQFAIALACVPFTDPNKA